MRANRWLRSIFSPWSLIAPALPGAASIEERMFEWGVATSRAPTVEEPAAIIRNGET
ncbi:hypothetical protein [Microbacterium marmarense]|uniref:Uncharacterized protein n=1 Tax=Microbacterium marmarense TaxID=3122051 RepID=A0ABU8LVZ0_9MICO